VLVYYAFDLLQLEDLELTREPLSQRREALSQVVAGSRVLLSEPLPGSPADIERELRRLGLEGVVAKRVDSKYEPGERSDAWLKVKFQLAQEFVIGGFTPDGDRVDALVVGYYDKKRLMAAGKVRAGLRPGETCARGDAPAVEARTCPFVNLPNSKHGRWGEGLTAEDMTSIVWVKPSLAAGWRSRWTDGGSLRCAVCRFACGQARGPCRARRLTPARHRDQSARRGRDGVPGTAGNGLPRPSVERTKTRLAFNHLEEWGHEPMPHAHGLRPCALILVGTMLLPAGIFAEDEHERERDGCRQQEKGEEHHGWFYRLFHHDDDRRTGAASDECRVQLAIGDVGYSIWDDGSIALAIPIVNEGDSPAASVQVSSLTFGRGKRAKPVTLPFPLGEIVSEQRAVLQSRFTSLATPGNYALAVSGTYTYRGTSRPFTARTQVAVARPVPGPTAPTRVVVPKNATPGVATPPSPIPQENGDNPAGPPVPDGHLGRRVRRDSSRIVRAAIPCRRVYYVKFSSRPAKSADKISRLTLVKRLVSPAGRHDAR
jgi:bifunctional non-homologous end joining protein LigD